MDHFEFLHKIKIGQEVLTSEHGSRIFEVTGVTDKWISTSQGRLYDKETGIIAGTSKSNKYNIPPVVLQWLSPERKEAILKENKEKEAQRVKEEKENAIINAYWRAVGDKHSSRRPSVENMAKITKFIEKL